MVQSGDSVRAFLDAVHRDVEPIVARAGFQWKSIQEAAGHEEFVVLFESSPSRFKERYPEYMPDYGPQEPLCVDLWVRYRPTERALSADLEGLQVLDWLTDNGLEDLAADIINNRQVDASVRALGRALQQMFRGQ